MMPHAGAANSKMSDQSVAAASSIFFGRGRSVFAQPAGQVGRRGYHGIGTEGVGVFEFLFTRLIDLEFRPGLCSPFAPKPSDCGCDLRVCDHQQP